MSFLIKSKQAMQSFNLIVNKLQKIFLSEKRYSLKFNENVCIFDKTYEDIMCAYHKIVDLKYLHTFKHISRLIVYKSYLIVKYQSLVLFVVNIN